MSAIALTATTLITATPQPANAFILGWFNQARSAMRNLTESKPQESRSRAVLPIEEAQMMYDFEVGTTSDYLTGQPRQAVIVPGTGIKAGVGSEVYAIADGTITKAAHDGQPVTLPYRYILNFDGNTFLYMGVDLSVPEGSRVTKGQIIGTVAEADMFLEYRVDGQPKNIKELDIIYPKSNDFFGVDDVNTEAEVGCDDNGCG